MTQTQRVKVTAGPIGSEVRDIHAGVASTKQLVLGTFFSHMQSQQERLLSSQTHSNHQSPPFSSNPSKASRCLTSDPNVSQTSIICHPYGIIR
jgi:hypothetical protein